ncbi:hypothetical protein FACS189437_09970 [Bacteroidia bacterium]|nr:hypothetical protein FACS189437_09970 [Bacteroidia bacterium]
MKINIFYNTKLPPAQRRTKLFETTVAAALGRSAKFEGEVNLIFISGREIRKINKQFLSHDYETDVIAFQYPSGPEILLGDIFVCVKIAQKNAALYKQSVLRELMTYAVHGALHLTGMDDATPSQRAAMDKKTVNVLTQVKKQPRQHRQGIPAITS